MIQNTTTEEDKIIAMADSLGLSSLIEIIERLDSEISELKDTVETLQSQLDS